MKVSSFQFDLPTALVTALRTLTILPVPGKDTDTPKKALPWFPLVGTVLGVLIWAPLVALQNVFTWPAGVAIIAVGLSIFLTRGLHLDGLADWADGFWGGWNRERILEIMKDSSLGTFGTAALVLILLAKWCSIAALVEHGNMHWIILSLIISRFIQVDLAVAHPYARAEGGTGSAFISEADQDQWRPAFWSALVLVILIGGFSWRPIVTLLLATVVGRAFGRWCKAKVGGVTGDLLGASSEITETLVLMLGAASL